MLHFVSLYFASGTIIMGLRMPGPGGVLPLCLPPAQHCSGPICCPKRLEHTLGNHNQNLPSPNWRLRTMVAKTEMGSAQ